MNMPPLGYSLYTANKAYLESMSRSWALENSKFGITSNSISPSLMETGFHKDYDSRILDMARQDNPTGELVKVEDVAMMVRFFLETSVQVNAINVPINGGTDVR